MTDINGDNNRLKINRGKSVEKRHSIFSENFLSY